MSDKQLAVLLEQKIRDLKRIYTDLFYELEPKYGVDMKNPLVGGTRRDVPLLASLNEYIDDLESDIEFLGGQA